MRKKSSDVLRSDGPGSLTGSKKLNKRLMTPQPDVERTSMIRDPMYQWPSMYEEARSLTKGKWGKTAKDIKVGK